MKPEDQKKSAELARTLPIADVHMHDAFGWAYVDKVGVYWGGYGSKTRGRYWEANKESLGDRFIAWGGQTELNNVYFKDGMQGMLDPNNPGIVKLYKESEEDFKAGRIVGIGEIFINNKSSNPQAKMRRKGQVDGASIRKFFDLAAKYDGFLGLHMETDSDSKAELGRLLASNRKGRVILAHCGVKSNADEIRDLLAANPNLFCDLSFRSPPVNSTTWVNIFDANGISGNWRQLIEDYPDRFMVGTDAYKGDDFVGAIKTIRSGLLPNLTPETARLVAYGNAQRLFKLKTMPPS